MLNTTVTSNKMKALYHFIVRIPKTHRDTITVGETELYLDPKFNEFENRVCYGEVVSLPMKQDSPVKVGDTMFFHHHVSMNKRLKINDDLYMVVYDPDNGYSSHAIAFRNSEGEVIMLSDWIFIEPIEQRKELHSELLEIVEVDKGEAKRGKVMMTNEELEYRGLNVGDTVVFMKSADYKMVLDDGTEVWRMKADDLIYVEEEVHND